MKKITANLTLLPVLKWIGFSIIPLLVYAFLLLNRINLLRPVTSQVRYGFSFVFPLVFIILILIMLLPGRWSGPAGLAFIAALCGFALAGLWISGRSEPSSAISGLIPYSDAARHYTDALGFLQGFDMSLFSAERPMYAVLLSALMGITGYNLQVSVAVVGFLAALSFYPVLRQVQRSHGVLAAAFAVTVLFFYYRRFSGTTLSESMGVILGNCGFALLWAAGLDKDLKTALLGLFITSAALNARPGPMFLIPLFVLWAAVLLRKSSWISWRVFGLGLAVSLVPFIINSLITRQVDAETIIPFHHFTYALYGVVYGGVGFGVVATDHPELHGLPARELTLAIYRLIFTHFSQHPFDFVLGVWKEIRFFFSNTGYNMFSYLSSENPLADGITFYGMYLLSLLGIGASLKKWKEPHAALLLAGLVGVALSLPFARPSDAAGLRLYAAGILPMIMAPTLGLAFIAGFIPRVTPRLDFLARPGPAAGEAPAPLWGLASVLGLLLVFGTLCLPAAIKALRQPAPAPAFNCPTGQDAVVVRYSAGNFVRVIPENVLQLDGMPEFHRSRFRIQAHAASTGSFVDELEHVESPSTVFSTVNLQDGVYVVFVGNTDQMPEKYGVVRACGWRGAKDSRNRESRIYFATSVKWIGY